MLFEQKGDPETIHLKDGELRLWSQFIDTVAAQRLWDALHRDTPWQQSVITIAGLPRKIPRLNAWYGDAGYRYSGARFEPYPWTPPLWKLKQQIETATGASFNSVLVNLYRDGNDSVSWHSDDEPELGARPVIASFSLGATRTFQLKHRADKKRLKLPLTSGSLLLMEGDIQHCWLHQLPKEPSVHQPRINCTFRSVIAGL